MIHTAGSRVRKQPCTSLSPGMQPYQPSSKRIRSRCPSPPGANPAAQRHYCVKHCTLRDNDPMVQCDKCDRWYHIECVGLTIEEAELAEWWHCSGCRTKKVKSVILNIRGVSRRFQMELPVGPAFHAAVRRDVKTQTNNHENIGRGHLAKAALAHPKHPRPNTAPQANKPKSRAPPVSRKKLVELIQELPEHLQRQIPDLTRKYKSHCLDSDGTLDIGALSAWDYSKLRSWVLNKSKRTQFSTTPDSKRPNHNQRTLYKGWRSGGSSRSNLSALSADRDSMHQRIMDINLTEGRKISLVRAIGLSFSEIDQGYSFDVQELDNEQFRRVRELVETWEEEDGKQDAQSSSSSSDESSSDDE